MTPLRSGHPVPDNLLDQATRFRARLADTPTNAALIARIDAWRAENPLHEAAWQEGGLLWSSIEGAARRVVDRERKRRWRTRTAVAAALLLAVLIAPSAMQFGDTLRSDAVTHAGERRVIALADGSRITLNSDTALAVDLDDGGHRTARLFRGEAFFDIHHDPARPFVIDARGSRVAVLGTRFDIRLGSTGVKVAVEQGRVRFEAEGMEAVLAAGEQALAADGRIDRSAVAVADVAGWRQGRVVFYNARIAQVIEELNRYRQGHIVILNRGLSDRRITANFRTDDPEASLDALLRGIGGRATRLPGGIVLLY